MKKILIYFGYAVSVAALLTVFAHMIALSLYVFGLIALVCVVAHFHLRKKPDDLESSKRNRTLFCRRDNPGSSL